VECDEDGEPVVGPPQRRTEIRVVRDGESAVRVILDPFGEDHDVFVECHADKWLVCIHPAGSDPIVAVELQANNAVVTDLLGKVLIKEEW
jgi:hypothetical protein